MYIVKYFMVNTSETKKLTFLILLLGKVCSKFSKDGISASQVVQKITMKCAEAWRPQIIRISSRVEK